jgi:hypothetical protein
MRLLQTANQVYKAMQILSLLMQPAIVVIFFSHQQQQQQHPIDRLID